MIPMAMGVGPSFAFRGHPLPTCPAERGRPLFVFRSSGERRGETR